MHGDVKDDEGRNFAVHEGERHNIDGDSSFWENVDLDAICDLAVKEIESNDKKVSEIGYFNEITLL